MSLTAAQLTAFQANGGFTPAVVASLLTAGVFVVLLLWGAWAMRTAYVGWAEERLSQRQFIAVVLRFAAIYLAMTYLLLS